jgi:hypothetical protein
VSAGVVAIVVPVFWLEIALRLVVWVFCKPFPIPPVVRLESPPRLHSRCGHGQHYAIARSVLCKGSSPFRVARVVPRHEREEEVPPVGRVALLARHQVGGIPEEPHGARVGCVDQERPIAGVLSRES